MNKNLELQLLSILSDPDLSKFSAQQHASDFPRFEQTSAIYPRSLATNSTAGLGPLLAREPKNLELSSVVANTWPFGMGQRNQINAFGGHGFGEIDAALGNGAGRGAEGQYEKSGIRERIVVSLRSYQIGTLPVYGPYHHAYVQIDSLETGGTYILRGGPSEDYARYATSEQIVSETPVRGKYGSIITLVAKLTTAAASLDRPGNHPLITESFRWGPLSKILQKAEQIADAYNRENSPYAPRTNNSNTFARNAFELLGARDYIDNVPKLPGSGYDNRRKIRY